jgi:fatty acid desaturase
MNKPALSKELNIRFSQQERQRLRQVNPTRLVWDLSLSWLQAISGCALFITYPGVATWLIAIVLVAGAQHGLSMISHEAAHRLIWPKNKRVNDFIATWLFAAPAMLPFNVYRHRHLIHHRLVSRKLDTKTLYRRKLKGWRFGLELLRSLSGMDYCQQAIEALRHGKQQKSAQFSARLRRDQRAILVVQFFLFLVFLAFDPLYYGMPVYYFILWLGPLLTLSFFFAKLRSIAEHQPLASDSSLQPESIFFMNTPGPMLRSVRPRWFERLLLTKINFHYHAEHHLWPWISYQHLPEVNQRIWQGKTGMSMAKNNQFAMDDSYWRVFKKMISGQ